MGNTCYATGEEIREGAHVYCHSRKDGKDGVVYLVINNSAEDTTLDLATDAELYLLSGDGKLRSRVMTLNGKPLTLGEHDELPELCGEKVSAGKLTIPAGNCAFVVM